MSYRHFIQVCFDHADGRGVKMLPMPNQLLGPVQYRKALVARLQWAIDNDLPDMRSRHLSRYPVEGTPLPACMGIPGLCSSENPVCAACPLATRCKAVAEEVRALAPTSKDEAQRQKMRERDRLKKQRKRARQKLVA